MCGRHLHQIIFIDQRLWKPVLMRNCLFGGIFIELGKVSYLSSGQLLKLILLHLSLTLFLNFFLNIPSCPIPSEMRLSGRSYLSDYIPTLQFTLERNSVLLLYFPCNKRMTGYLKKRPHGLKIL